MANLKTVWTSGLPAEEVKALVDMLQNSSVLQRRLLQLIDKKINEIEVQETKNGFDQPSWALHQAFLIGRKKELKDLRSLFE